MKTNKPGTPNGMIESITTAECGQFIIHRRCEVSEDGCQQSVVVTIESGQLMTELCLSDTEAQELSALLSKISEN